MADRYWVGGTDNWDGTAGTKWATVSGGGGGASVPTTSDDVYFDGNSGGVCTYSAGATNCKSLIFQDTYTGTFSLGFSIGIAGSLRLGLNMTWGAGASAISFTSSSAETLRSNGKAISNNVTFNGTGSWTLLDNFQNTVGARILSISKGSVYANGFTISTSVFSCAGASVRLLDLANSAIVMGGTSATPWTVSGSNLSMITAGSTISFTSNTTNALAFAGGGIGYGTVLVGGTGARTVTFTGANTFASLAVSGGVKTLVFPSGQTTTVGSAAISGSGSGAKTVLQSSTPGTPATLGKSGGGIVSLDYLSVQDIAASPVSIWFAGSHSTDVSGNTGWSFTPPICMTPIVGSRMFDSPIVRSVNNVL